MGSGYAAYGLLCWTAVLLLAASVGPAVAGGVHIADLECPEAEVVVHPGDLSAMSFTPGFTYRLRPGHYNLTTSLSFDDPKCTCIIGDCEQRGDVVVRNGAGFFAFSTAGKAELGLHKLTLDGQAAAGGVSAGADSTVVLLDVAVQNTMTQQALMAQSAHVTAIDVAFINNVAAVRAPIILSGGHYHWSKVDFQDNAGVIGAALFINSHTLLKLADASFVGGYAMQSLLPPAPAGTAGAVYLAAQASLILSGDCDFLSNHADGDGGAVVLRSGARLVVEGTSRWADNDAGFNGGAIAMTGSHAKLEVSGHAVFSGNKVLAGSGGALYLSGVGSKAQVDGHVSFDSNYVVAGNGGGAIYVGPFTKLTLSGGADFTSNFVQQAGNGGAIGLGPNACVTATCAVSFDGNNAAGNGGAIGSVSADHALVTLLGEASFVNNYAVNGGALSVGGAAAQLVLMGQTTLSGNYANTGSGGAINMDAGCFVNLGGPFSAQGNHAAGPGGGIYVSPTSPPSLVLSGASAQQTMANNLPDDINVPAGGGFVCTSDASNPRGPGPYTIVGPVCACAPTNATSPASSCGCNGTDVWNPLAHTCQAANLQTLASVTLSPPRLFAGQHDPASLMATVRDISNNPMSNVAVTFTMLRTAASGQGDDGRQSRYEYNHHYQHAAGYAGANSDMDTDAEAYESATHEGMPAGRAAAAVQAAAAGNARLAGVSKVETAAASAVPAGSGAPTDSPVQTAAAGGSKVGPAAAHSKGGAKGKVAKQQHKAHISKYAQAAAPGYGDATLYEGEKTVVITNALGQASITLRGDESGTVVVVASAPTAAGGAPLASNAAQVTFMDDHDAPHYSGGGGHDTGYGQAYTSTVDLPRPAYKPAQRGADGDAGWAQQLHHVREAPPVAGAV